MAALTPSELVAASNCFECIQPNQRLPALLYLFNELLPMPLTPSQLVAASACFECIQPSSQMPALLYLGTQILAGGSSGGIGGVVCAAGDPVADPGVTCALHYNTNTGSLWIWNAPLAQWNIILGP